MTPYSPLEKVWDPELLLAGWMSASFMLMTVSLIFYHMTRVSSLEMSKGIAALFAVALISVSAVLCITGLATYSMRIQNVLEHQRSHKYRSKYAEKGRKQEEDFRIVYIVMGSILAIVEVAIAGAICAGSFRTL
jgi:uncharacterized membrane protein